MDCRKCYDSKPYSNFNELVSRMLEVYEIAEKNKHLEILNSHPDLVVEKKLTDEI